MHAVKLVRGCAFQTSLNRALLVSTYYTHSTPKNQPEEKVTHGNSKSSKHINKGRKKGDKRQTKKWHVTEDELASGLMAEKSKFRNIPIYTQTFYKNTPSEIKDNFFKDDNLKIKRHFEDSKISRKDLQSSVAQDNDDDDEVDEIGSDSEEEFGQLYSDILEREKMERTILEHQEKLTDPFEDKTTAWEDNNEYDPVEVDTSINSRALAFSENEIISKENKMSKEDYIVEKINDEYDSRPLERKRLKFIGNTPAEPIWRQIDKYGKMFEPGKAVALLESMYQKHGLVPPSKVYASLLRILARLGHVEKAFYYYEQAKSLKVHLKADIYVNLFNACYQCEDFELGKKHAYALLKELREKEVPLNNVVYFNMIKVFGKYGDLELVMKLADEAVEKRLRLGDQFFFHLLMAVKNDKERGLYYAILIWRRMMLWRIVPDEPFFCLLLQTIFHCGLGEKEDIQFLLSPPIKYRNQKKSIASRGIDVGMFSSLLPANRSVTKLLSLNPSSDKQSVNQKLDDEGKTIKQARKSGNSWLEPDEAQKSGHSWLEPDQAQKSGHSWLEPDQPPDAIKPERHQEAILSSETSVPPSSASALIPNLLDVNESYRDATLPDIKTTLDKFALVGGLEGLLQLVKKCNVKFTDQLFYNLMSMFDIRDRDSERSLLAAMRNFNVKPTHELLNTVLSRRSKGGDRSDRKEVLQLMADYNLSPDLKTYMALACSCRTVPILKEFLHDLDKNEVVIGEEIILNLLKVHRYGFFHKAHVIQELMDRDIQPSRKVIRQIEERLIEGRNIVLRIERQTQHDPKEKEKAENFIKSFNIFTKKYERWLKYHDLKSEIPQFDWLEEKIDEARKEL